MPLFLASWGSLTWWVITLVVLLIVEACTVNLVTIWFAVGALAAIITCFFTNQFAIQVLVFALVSVAALLITKPLVDRIRQRRPASPLGIERLIGRRAEVLTDLIPGEKGRVRLDGVDWQAVCTKPLCAGSFCKVVAVDATTLTVEPFDEPPV